jgi:hypothetical protein
MKRTPPGRGFIDLDQKPLILVVNHNGATMFARIGMMRALNHGKAESGIGAAQKSRQSIKLTK